MASTTTEHTGTTDPSLYKHKDFMKLWAGESLSLVGSQMTVLALPIVTFILLDASVAEMGFLGALGRLPMVLFLFVGVWVDRVSRRSVLVTSNLARAVILLTVPVLYFMDVLTLWWMYAVVLVMGVFGVFFEIAYRSYLPVLVPAAQLSDGNGKLQLSDSVAKSVGPGLAGLIVGVRSAPGAILLDALTYVASSVFLLGIKQKEEKPKAEEGGDSVVKAIGEGLRFVFQQPLIRPLAIASAVYSFFEVGILQTLYFPFVVRDVHVPAAWVGAVFAIGGVGAIIGAWGASRFTRGLGPGPTMLGCTIIGNSSLLLVPLAGGPLWLALLMLGFSQLVVGVTTQIFLVNNITILQSATPRPMIGRVIATIWAMGLVPAPLGALVAGLIGDGVGMRPVVLVAALIGGIVPVIVLALSPIRTLRQMPEAPAAPTPATTS